MPTPYVTRVFVPAEVMNGLSEGLEAASADEAFSFIGAPGQHDLAGFLVPVSLLELHGVPPNVAQMAAMILGLNPCEHAVLLPLKERWELRLQPGEGLPEIYSFDANSSSAPPVGQSGNRRVPLRRTTGRVAPVPRRSPLMARLLNLRVF